MKRFQNCPGERRWGIQINPNCGTPVASLLPAPSGFTITLSHYFLMFVKQAICCCKVASVMSDSVRSHRRQPTRLLHPWDSPGKNTGVGCHFPLQCMKVKSESEVVQSCPTLSDPMDCSPPGSSVHGIFQARVLEWGAIAFMVPCKTLFPTREFWGVGYSKIILQNDTCRYHVDNTQSAQEINSTHEPHTFERPQLLGARLTYS